MWGFTSQTTSGTAGTVTSAAGATAVETVANGRDDLVAPAMRPTPRDGRGQPHFAREVRPDTGSATLARDRATRRLPMM
jgi:hypothetical protein